MSQHPSAPRSPQSSSPAGSPDADAANDVETVRPAPDGEATPERAGAEPVEAFEVRRAPSVIAFLLVGVAVEDAVREQDHPRARAVDGQADLDEPPQRLEHAEGGEELLHDGGLAARDDEAVEGLEVTTWRFRAREHPDPVEFVQRAVSASPYRVPIARLAAAQAAQTG
mgnify:CR=1 FL=1